MGQMLSILLGDSRCEMEAKANRRLQSGKENGPGELIVSYSTVDSLFVRSS